MDRDDESLEGSQNNPKRVTPTIIQARDARATGYAANFYADRNKLIGTQMREAEINQFRADNGLCWQEDYILQPSLDDSVVGFGDLPESLKERVKWTGLQKATFLELLGRKGRSSIYEISNIVGKSVLECNAYLDLIQSNADQLVIDYCEIPAAEETPSNAIEFELGNVEVKREGLVEKNELECNMFFLQRIKTSTGKSLSFSAVHQLYLLLQSKLYQWIQGIEKLTMNGSPVVITPETVSQVVAQDLHSWQTSLKEHKDQILDELNREKNSDVQDSEERYSDAHDEDYTHTEELLINRLCEREAEWLEELDNFRTNLNLQARGLHAADPAIIKPPGIRESELEKFMQTR